MAEIYELPKHRIAQRPVYPPEAAKLLLVDRKTGSLTDLTFNELPSLLSANDLLVFNDTKVIPARIFGRDQTLEKEVELLLVTEVGENLWRCLGRSIKQGSVVQVVDDITGTVLEKLSNGEFLVKFSSKKFREYGTMPIPPYIRKGRGDKQDSKDYQTIFAKNDGSIAAPTASLHFSESLIGRIREREVGFKFLTLHVGTASFRQVSDSEPPAVERMTIDADTLKEIIDHKVTGGRVIAVGTTAVRALESAALNNIKDGETDLFIRPGFPFQLVDPEITNFHQPGTTHMLLVEALLGKDLLIRSYQHALNSNYRFLSYGDGMLVK